MWYRYAKSLLAARRVTDPEYTYHYTNREYEYPIVDPDPSSIMSTNGFGHDAYGPGYYTSQNQKVLEGYQRSNPENGYTRKIRLPRGTNILDWNNLTREEADQIYAEFGRRFRPNKVLEPLTEKESYTLQEIKNMLSLRKEETYNHILNKMGFDAISYRPFETYNDTNDKGKGDNILILNDQIVNNPREFTKSRLRPEYNSTPKNTLPDIYQEAVQKGTMPEAALAPRFLPESKIRQMVFQGKITNKRQVPQGLLHDARVVKRLLADGIITHRDLPYADDTYLIDMFKKGGLQYYDLPEETQQLVWQWAYENQKIAFRELPENVRSDKDYVLQQLKKGEASLRDVGIKLLLQPDFVRAACRENLVKHERNVPFTWMRKPELRKIVEEETGLSIKDLSVK